MNEPSKIEEAAEKSQEPSTEAIVKYRLLSWLIGVAIGCFVWQALQGFVAPSDHDKEWLGTALSISNLLAGFTFGLLVQHVIFGVLMSETKPEVDTETTLKATPSSDSEPEIK